MGCLPCLQWKLEYIEQRYEKGSLTLGELTRKIQAKGVLNAKRRQRKGSRVVLQQFGGFPSPPLLVLALLCHLTEKGPRAWLGSLESEGQSGSLPSAKPILSRGTLMLGKRYRGGIPQCLMQREGNEDKTTLLSCWVQWELGPP